MLLGAHVSVAGGLVQALDYAQSVGCECIQIFAKSPRQWRGGKFDPVGAAVFVEERRRRDFGPVFSHTAYLINLATPHPGLREKSIAALADELTRGGLLEVDGVVTHIGHDPDCDAEAAASRVGEAIVEAYERAGEAALTARLLLENTAGAGHTFGASIPELAGCIEAAGLPSRRLGVCLDTCHAFAYGMRVDTPDGWAEIIAGISALCGAGRLGLIHANDCLFERGSRRDRHAWIGGGFIGNAGFEAMLCRPELAPICAITEMPGERPDKDLENLGRLKALRHMCSPSQGARNR